MELGNMIFGNSRGEHPVNRDLQDEFHSCMERMGFDSYGHHPTADWAFENDVFRMQPYYWGDCTCGFDERDHAWSEENHHAVDCYQSELRRQKAAAGGVVQDAQGGWIERPAAMSYEAWQAVEREIMDRLCAKHSLDPMFGCAAHCTCSHNADYKAWRDQNDHSSDCPIVTPNFFYKPSGFSLDWYKYPLRDSYSSQPLTRKLMREMFADCIASMTHDSGRPPKGEDTRSGAECEAGQSGGESRIAETPANPLISGVSNNG